MRKLLIANRGEVAIRIARAAAELGVETLAVAPQDDASCLHTRRADAFATLPGRGVAAYLDIAQLLSIAKREGCDAVHPGYGFLSESAGFAEACEDARLVFVGPTPSQLSLLGDKRAARERALELGVPVLPGSSGAASPAQARAMLLEQGEGARLMLKAAAGGGGRGMRILDAATDLEAAFERCTREAEAYFGSPDLYLERLVERARHLEVQIASARSSGSTRRSSSRRPPRGSIRSCATRSSTRPAAWRRPSRTGASGPSSSCSTATRGRLSSSR
jgi:acetyl/propionyl-CoA carboxylase alpha subunit